VVCEDDVTVYAYKMQHQGNFWTRSMADPWCDLTADTEDEATRIEQQRAAILGVIYRT
jgi:hypothetical protein